MKGFGTLTAAGGAVVSVGSLFMRTSVHSDSTYNDLGFVPASDIINIGLLQNQHLVFLAGCFVFLAGVVICCTGCALDAFRDVSQLAAGLTPGIEDPAAEGYQLRIRSPADMTDDEKQAASKADKTIIIVAIVLGIAALIAVFAFGAGTSNQAERPEVVNNADGMADNITAAEAERVVPHKSKR